ncbi:MAG TPA: hypothetical protein VF807_03425 [Ktedonobacterales bacterium]
MDTSDPHEGETQHAEPAHVENEVPSSSTARIPQGGPRVQIGVAEGRLHITGGADAVRITLPAGEEDAPQAVDHNGGILLHELPDGADLQVPHGAEVIVRAVQGALVVEGLNGSLDVTTAEDDVELYHVLSATLGTVQGDVRATDSFRLEARDLEGDVRIERIELAQLRGRVEGSLEAHDIAELLVEGPIEGDATIDHCGQTNLASVSGSLHVSQCAAVILIDRINGDADFESVAGVSVRAIDGDLTVNRCAGETQAAKVSGDVRLRNVYTASLGRVDGDLLAESISGPLAVEKLIGDAEIRDVHGMARLTTVGGDLHAVQCPNGLVAQRVSGDTAIVTSLREGSELGIETGGDLELKLRGTVNARFVAIAGGEVTTELPLTVERGKRQHLVGMLGNGAATVTLRSGGDIEITASDDTSWRNRMSDDFVNDQPQGQSRTFESVVNGKTYRVHVNTGPGKARVHFEGPGSETPTGEAKAGKTFGVEWEEGKGAHTFGEYDAQIRDFGAKAEDLARKTAKAAEDYAERASKWAKGQDWEAVGREVRGALNKALTELEEAFTRMRQGFEGSAGSGSSSRQDRPPSQRVKIEHDDADPFGSNASAPWTAPAADAETQRRQVLEQLRSGSLSLEEAEQRLREIH